MIATPTELPEVVEIEPVVRRDERGWFFESYVEARYAAVGIGPRFVQDNVSYSRAGVVRGLHLQHPHGQGKLVGALEGAIWDVACDVRVGSPTFGRWVARTLSSERMNQLWIPEGFAHGFAVLGQGALVHYKCTAGYHPESALGIAWDDPALGIEWPIAAAVLSDADRAQPRLAAVDDARLPRYPG